MKRPWALPLTPLWALATAARNHAYDRRHLPTRHLQRPVVSIGSLSAGGAGKTPVVLALARLLVRHGITADVLSRGYGRGSGAVEQVDPAGDPGRYGDEPLEIALEHVPVVVAADRHAAGVLSESTLQTRLHLLDDGFQHRRLARDLDLVLLTAADVRDYLLPAGNLREPLSSLARAHAILLREEDAAALAPVAARHAPQARQWLIRRSLHLPSPVPEKALAFCGLARPKDFFAHLRTSGLSLASHVSFPDHYRYTAQDITTLCHAAQRVHTDAFVTTAKDAVKLAPDFRARLEAVAPLHIVRLQVTFLEETGFFDFLRARLSL